MTSFGTQGRVFTYVITLDGEMRFTETGEDFAIELLSKHSMHADVAGEIAYSGELQDEDPKHYELVIDNDSGTYRPRKELLPILEEFLAGSENFGGLGRVLTVDCFNERLEKWKEERKETARGKGKKERPPSLVQVRSDSMSSVVSSIESGNGRWCGWR